MIEVAKVHDVVKGEIQPTGTVILVDRLWPRGIAKRDLHYDHWFKDVAPSPELRQWWGHDPDTFDEFARRYRAELDAADAADAAGADDSAGAADAARAAELEELRQLAGDESSGLVTLLFAASDRSINHAVVLRDWLEENA